MSQASLPASRRRLCARGPDKYWTVTPDSAEALNETSHDANHSVGLEQQALVIGVTPPPLV